MRYLLSLSVLILFSCSSMKKQGKQLGSDAGSSLSGTEWTLSSIPGFDIEETRKPVTLTFVDTTNRVYGNAGCNGFGGNYTAKGSALKIEKVIATKMACMPGMQTENKVFMIFSEADHYRISGDKLSLMKGEKVLAEYSRGKKDEK